MILLEAEMLELKANHNRNAIGTIIEAKLDRGRGPVATILVKNGTVLRKNSSLLQSLTLQDFSDLIFNHYGNDMYISSIYVFDV
jgi:translation initiation factor IF-2